MKRCILGTLVLILGGVLSDSADGLSVPARPGTPVAVPKAEPVPAPPVSETLVLPPLSPAEEAMKGVEESAEKGIFQTGVLRELPEDILMTAGNPSVGRWVKQPDGSVIWAIALESPGSIGVRVEVSDALLPPGVRLWVYGEGLSEELPYSSSQSVWSATAFGERVVIACVAGPGAPGQRAPLEPVHFRIASIVHQYTFPGYTGEKNAGACNLDENCHPAWDSMASGVGGLGTVGSNGALFCTGTLINTASGCDDTPYVLTANHCVGGQTGTRGADSLEFYWNYETNACNGTAPSPSTVPRTTGGADYLGGDGGTGFSGGGNDFTLLRMRNDPPANLTRVGWTSDPIPLGTQVTCVHHPRGDFRRITFGTLTNTDNVYADDYHEVTWDQGTTEPGSSGSPLLLTDTQQIIGQLWGGGASCFALLEPDYYGRFDVTYPQIEAFLLGESVSLAAASVTVSEGDGVVQLSVTLNTPAPVGGYALRAVVTPGTAIAGLDVDMATVSFTVAEGVDEGTFSILIVDDTHTESDETFLVQLETDESCLSVNPEAATVTVTITDDDLDTDGDGLSDVDELSGFLGAVTDPLRSDSDRDGLNDYDEQNGTYGPPTEPNVFDTDGDGAGDWFEIFNGTDPLAFEAQSVSSMRVPWFRSE